MQSSSSTPQGRLKPSTPGKPGWHHVPHQHRPQVCLRPEVLKSHFTALALVPGAHYKLLLENRRVSGLFSMTTISVRKPQQGEEKAPDENPWLYCCQCTWGKGNRLKMSKILHLTISWLQHRSQKLSPSVHSTVLQPGQSLETAEGEVSEEARGKHQAVHQIGSFRLATQGKVGNWGRGTDQKQRQPSNHSSCASTSASTSSSTQCYHILAWCFRKL